MGCRRDFGFHLMQTLPDHTAYPGESIEKESDADDDRKHEAVIAWS